MKKCAGIYGLIILLIGMAGLSWGQIIANPYPIPFSYLDTDTSLTANSDAKVPTQKAVKAAIAGGSTTGSAGSLKSPATTGLMTVTGMGAGTTRNATVPDSDFTILYDGKLSGTFGVGGSSTGSVILKNISNANAFTLQPGTTGEALSWTLPIAAPSGNGYLVTASTAGVITYTDPTTWLDLHAKADTAGVADTVINGRYTTDSDYTTGWTAAGETWTYAAADAPTYTFTVPTDLTGKYSPGMRIKLTDGTVKYFIITVVAYGAPNTTITVYGGTDYTLSGGAITLPFYSTFKAPLGFPLNPTKWTVEVSDTANRYISPAANVWANINASLAITIPIGIWNVSYNCMTQPQKATGIAIADQYVTLSTAVDSETNVGFTTSHYQSAVAATIIEVHASLFSLTPGVLLAAKTIFYMNAKTSQTLDYVGVRGDLQKTFIRAVCAYL